VDVLVLDEATRGVHVSSKAQIRSGDPEELCPASVS
jgi:hypothetical protein